jgi:hypothetical protein
MNVHEETAQTSASGVTALELDPDIRALGEYLAEKQGMTIAGFVEYLITTEASKRMISRAE